MISGEAMLSLLVLRRLTLSQASCMLGTVSRSECMDLIGRIQQSVRLCRNKGLKFGKSVRMNAALWPLITRSRKITKSRRVLVVAVVVLLMAIIGLLEMDHWLFEGCPDCQRANTLSEFYKTVVLKIHLHLGT